MKNYTYSFKYLVSLCFACWKKTVLPPRRCITPTSLGVKMTRWQNGSHSWVNQAYVLGNGVGIKLEEGKNNSKSASFLSAQGTKWLWVFKKERKSHFILITFPNGTDFHNLFETTSKNAIYNLQIYFKLQFLKFV